MSLQKPTLPSPTSAMADQFIAVFEASQDAVERALTNLFTLLPYNEELEDVLLKVVSLNDLYRTNIFATYKVAQHIHQLNIDASLQSGEPHIVNSIAQVSLGDKVRNNYSFATKYCSWHNPDAYPIYDSYVDNILWAYQKQHGFSRFHRYDLWNYDLFRKTIIAFQAYYHLESYSMKDIDKFLWLMGKKYFPQPWDIQPISDQSDTQVPR